MKNNITIEKIVEEWAELTGNQKILQSLLRFYGRKYKDLEISDYRVEENNVYITPVKSLDEIKIVFKVEPKGD